MGQGPGRSAANPVPGVPPGRGIVRVGPGRMQSCQIAPAAGGSSTMTRERACALIGDWRIVEADLWDRDYLDIVQPAYMTIEDRGHDRFAFGCVQGNLDSEYSSRTIFFTWQGNDEMDEVWGDGSAELEDDGFLDIELRFHHSGEANLKAQKW